MSARQNLLPWEIIELLLPGVVLQQEQPNGLQPKLVWVEQYLNCQGTQV